MTSKYASDIELIKKNMEGMDIKLECILGAISGDIEHPETKGILERLRNLEARWNIASRLVWLGLGSTLGGVIAILVALIKG